MSQIITLKHATPRKNILSILRTGIDPSYSTGKLFASWFHTRRRSKWIIHHTAEKHQVDLTDICLLTVVVDRSWIRRRKNGIWTCNRTIPPSQIVSINPFASAA